MHELANSDGDRSGSCVLVGGSVCDSYTLGGGALCVNGMMGVFTLGVFKALSESEVNDVDLVFGLVRSPNQKIVRLDIPDQHPLRVT